MLALVLLVTAIMLPTGVGKLKSKPKFSQVFSNNPEINWLSAARLFLFGARDVWFVVGLPVYLYSVLGWSFTEVGSFFALWIIGYGMVQGAAPTDVAAAAASVAATAGTVPTPTSSPPNSTAAR